MEKLEVKHLAPYLPYGLKMYTKAGVWDLVVYKAQAEYKYGVMIGEAMNCGVKPILRPLSELKFSKDFILKFGGDNPNNLKMCKLDIDDLVNNGLEFETYYGYYEWLLENHFDVFGLIDKGLAIGHNLVE
jgi:hypothetical protein